jgi:hypothetical protein
MDAELSRIAADVLRPGEQLLWAGKPQRIAQLLFPRFFSWVFFGVLGLMILLIPIAGADAIPAIINSFSPIVLIVGFGGFIAAVMKRKFARPEYNTFLLTRDRAIHVFQDGQTRNVASVPLDSHAKVELSARSGHFGTLLIKRKPAPGDTVATVPLLRPRRSAWSGVRFTAVTQPEYVRDVANWSIAQNQQIGPGVKNRAVQA